MAVESSDIGRPFAFHFHPRPGVEGKHEAARLPSLCGSLRGTTTKGLACAERI